MAWLYNGLFVVIDFASAYSVLESGNAKANISTAVKHPYIYQNLAKTRIIFVEAFILLEPLCGLYSIQEGKPHYAGIHNHCSEVVLFLSYLVLYLQ